MSLLDDAFALLAGLVLEDGRRWGEVATPLQRDDARALLDPTAEQVNHWLGRSRGYSKTTDVAAMTAAVMLTQAPAGVRLYAAAADRDQARLITDALGGFVHRSPQLHGALTVDQYRATTSRGVVLEVLAADAASAYGLRPWWLVLDELCQWPDTVNARRFHEALTSALPKTAGARSVTITTAGDPSSWPRKVYDQALAEADLWRVSEVHGPAPWIPTRLVEAERRRLPESSFLRLFENRWTASEDRLLNGDDVAECAVLSGPLDPAPGVTYVVSVDLGWRDDRTAVCVAHREPDGDAFRVVCDRLEVMRGSRKREVELDVVEARVLELARWYNHARVVADPAQMIGALQRLRKAGINATEHTFTLASNTRLALRLLELVRAHRLIVPADEQLVDELVNVRIVEKGPGLYRVDHDPGRHDDQVVALGMAAVALESLPMTGAAFEEAWRRIAARDRGELPPLEYSPGEEYAAAVVRSCAHRWGPGAGDVRAVCVNCGEQLVA